MREGPDEENQGVIKLKALFENFEQAHNLAGKITRNECIMDMLKIDRCLPLL